jgi:hypothetical protein
MKVLYSWKDEKCEAAISDDSDWMLFNGVAEAILRRFRGKLVERLDGLDERYWDIEIRGRIVTLHLQHYLGIMLFAAKKEENDLIREIGEYLETIQPKRFSREWFNVRNVFRIR